MKSTLFSRAKTRREPAIDTRETTASKRNMARDNITPASMDDHDIYFDQTPRPTERKSISNDDERSRPPPTNPEAVSVTSSTNSLRRKHGRTSRNSSPVLQRSGSTIPPKISVATFWRANEEFERKYDLTPVHNDAGVVGNSNSFTVDPWEQDGSKRGNSTGR